MWPFWNRKTPLSPFTEASSQKSGSISVNDKVVTELRNWLGPKGLSHFRDIKKKYGRVDAIWNEGGIPHCVHFREGMQVRNKLRELTNYTWTDHEYDGRWVEYIEKAIA